MADDIITEIDAVYNYLQYKIRQVVSLDFDKNVMDATYYFCDKIETPSEESMVFSLDDLLEDTIS